MGLALTEQQVLLRDTVSKFVADRYGFEARRRILDSETGWSAEVWRAFAEELGILGAAFPEAVGGLGGDATDVMVLMEELGGALVLEPFLETVVLGGGLLTRCPGKAAAEVIKGIIAGVVRLAFAYGEPQARHGWTDVLTTAVRDGGGWVIRGRKSVVFGAPAATHLIVSARTGGGQREAQGLTLVQVERDSPGVSLRPYRTIDGRTAAEVEFDCARISGEAVLSMPDAAGPIIEAALDDAAAAICAEASGVLQRLVSGTVEYAKARRQFGTAIASFQALQHRMVDMYVRAQQAAAMSQMAAVHLASAHDDRARAVSAAKAFVGEACRQVGQTAVQLHGAMGITDELAISHYFKRAIVIEAQFGSADYHLRRYQRMARNSQSDEIAA
jgi:alkylation response protein AidB-like acyl-CoA dehydrogenase